LRSRWLELDAKRREHLQRRAQHWSALLDGVIDDVAQELQVLGISKEEIVARVRRNRAAQLRAIGFEA
jgi:hypothetical protein